uniref:Clone ZZD1521 mRNA sequence n=1 Tax=Schistosoma japonicum TaxID=6182 RepID=Q86EQ9_SCHJA|nr:similar to XM_029844 adenylyl cyclase-associated protein in Homo sapiens [Schistosoma japonicum]
MERLDSLLCRLEKATIILEAAAVNSMYRTSPIKTSSESGNPLSVKEFHDIITGPLSEYVLYSSKIGDVVKTHASVVERCFLMEEEILKLASECSKPSDSELTLIMTLLGKEIEEVVKLKDNNRSNRFFNHLSAVAESVAALGWLSVSPAPAPYIKTMKEAAEFFTNRVIKEYEEKDTVHLAWKKALMSVLTALELYVKKHHTYYWVGWNARGKPATASKLSKSSPTREVNSNCSVALHTHCTYTCPLSCNIIARKKSITSICLFSDINRGEAVTSNLRKVTDDMKTHKNPKLREGPIMHTSRHQVNSSLNNTIIRSPAEKKGCLELKGNKWIVEYFNSVENLEVIITEPKQTVFIYKCNECTIRIKGKANSIMLDNCKKTGVVFDYLISSIDVVNCQSIQIQCLGKLSTVNID